MNSVAIKKETKRMVKMYDLPSDSLDRHAAYKKYCRTISRAMEEGRVWQRDVIRRLYPIALQLLDESELICLTELYEEAKDEARRRKREIRKKVKKLGR